MTAPRGGSSASSWTPGPGDWVVDPTVELPPARRRRHRRLLIGLVVLVVAATIVGVVVWRALDAKPGSPQEAAELFFAAEQQEDWSASWDLICTTEQQAVGSVERWIHLKETVVAEAEASPADLTVTVGRARPLPDSVPPAHMVEYYLPEDSGMYPLRMVVVEEDGGFAVCSAPESED